MRNEWSRSTTAPKDGRVIVGLFAEPPLGEFGPTEERVQWADGFGFGDYSWWIPGSCAAMWAPLIGWREE